MIVHKKATLCVGSTGCRLQRRLSFRNERGLYKATCDLCNKKIFSIVPDGKFKKLCVPCWISENWDPMDYGVDYDFTKPFFEQFKDLLNKVPVRALLASSNTLINSDYTNTSSNLKDCYLIYGSNGSENCIYGSEIIDSTDCIDCMMVENCSNSFNSVNCQKCSRVNNSIDCNDSLNISYSRNLSGCSYCFGCVNLVNKSYHIFNEPYTKEDYFLKIAELEGDSYSRMIENKKNTEEFTRKFPRKYIHGKNNNKISGDYVYNSKNTLNSFIVTGAEDCRYCFNLVMKPSKDCFDYSDWGGKC